MRSRSSSVVSPPPVPPPSAPVSSTPPPASPPNLRRALAALSLAVAALLATGCPPPPVSESLHLATANTFLRSPFMYCLQSLENLPDCMVQYSDVPGDNAFEIAAELLAEKHDVIVLNEVFDEDARKHLIAVLSPFYPHYVAKLDDDLIDFDFDGLKINGEDSGLMLFSRFPFEPLPNPVHRADPTLTWATTPEVAFIRFRDHAGDDQFAAKGVGLVRVRRPSSGIVHTIAFTHLQADYPEKNEFYPDERAHQLVDVERIIRDSLGSSALAAESVFVMGDLNVNGDGGVWDGTTPSGGTADWNDRFGAGGGFFGAQPMIDSWAAFNSKEDRGLTNFGDVADPATAERLDYVLVSGTQDFCVQHLTRRQVANSDHLLVAVDHNVLSPLCNPRRAWIAPPLDQLLDDQATPGDDRTKIDLPGSVQWYFFDLSQLVGQGGRRQTVSVGVRLGDHFNPVTGGGVTFELYDPTDLSRPIPQYRQETTNLSSLLDREPGLFGKLYHVPDRFFVKVFSPNPLWTGDYSPIVHRHQCQSAEDRCVLWPNEAPQRWGFDPNVLVGLEDERWFLVDVAEAADNGGPQQLRLFVGPYAKDIFEVRLVDRDDPTKKLADPPLTVDTPTMKELGGPFNGTRAMLLVVKRTDVTQGGAFDVGWQTDLTLMHGESGGGPGLWRAELQCLDETNPELGSDEIHLLISVDDGPWQEIYYHEYECNDGGVNRAIESELGTRRFVSSVRMKLIEEDGFVNPDDGGPTATIATLPASSSGAPQQFVFWKFADGHYRQTYNLSRCIP